MSALKSIRLAIELATLQRDECVKVVAQFRRAIEFAQSQMSQLRGYAEDTDHRWTASDSVSRSAELVHHHYMFMDRLQQAMGLQSGVLDNHRRQMDAAQAAMLQAEVRLAGLARVLKARELEMVQAQKKREQWHTDEFAAMQYARSRGQLSTGELL